MKIEMVPTVNSWDIEEEFGIRVLDCFFAQEEKNNSYFTLDLDEDNLQSIKKILEDYPDDDEDFYVKLCKNELKLIEKFRAMGYTENILVYVSW